ncbi:cupredoxin domain-containing protein [Sediminicola luteus]|jgi:plastocyanin|uniref:EfeO-type cupredoxin-like domain-containing protein n=1 Tax=Sediminicola luteus TaxID=319238 RepID=A0A2A4G4H1_9FLAO|nr:cupredoxin domain-containing protein [Sediminicola luteus]PCE62878.1 hypothetical protein B7P33_16505 [Sediminicola luteus]
MKKVIAIVALVFGFALTAQAQDKMMKTGTIALTQTPGEFTQKQLEVKEGTYVFEIANKGVGHDVGFVLVPKGKDITKEANHIKTAYVTQMVATGTTQKSKPTTLAKGEYVYFCPLNPTATDNTLVVK